MGCVLILSRSSRGDNSIEMARRRCNGLRLLTVQAAPTGVGVAGTPASRSGSPTSCLPLALPLASPTPTPCGPTSGRGPPRDPRILVTFSTDTNTVSLSISVSVRNESPHAGGKLHLKAAVAMACLLSCLACVDVCHRCLDQACFVQAKVAAHQLSDVDEGTCT